MFEDFTEDLKTLCIDLMPTYIGAPHQKFATKVKRDETPMIQNVDDYTMEKFRELIKTHFPDDETLGEEDGKTNSNIAQVTGRKSGRRWVIDGADGTWHLENGTNSYGAALAMSDGPDIVYTMYFRPIDYRLRGNGFFWAERGKGAWEWCECKQCGGGKYSRIETLKQTDRRLVVMLEGGSKNFWKTPIRNIGENLTTRPSLSSCIAATTIARGMVEGRVLVTSGHKPWDGWPIKLMVEEAGGVVTNHQGQPVDASNCNELIAAANPTDHARVLNLLNG